MACSEVSSDRLNDPKPRFPGSSLHYLSGLQKHDSDSSGLSSDSDESISDDDYTSNDVPTSWGSRSEEKRQPGAVQGLTRALRDFRLHAGQFKCRFTDLVFDMEREGTGEVMRKIVSWDSRVLDGLRHMEPAGPLYSIECHKGSIRRLHLPHCETRTDVVKLTVAHVTGINVEILQPLKVTNTHVIIEIQHLSLFGLLKPSKLLAYPIRAQVLLFYQKSLSKLHIHLLKRKLPVEEVQKRHGSMRYIPTSSKSILTPGKKYRPCCKTADREYVSQPEDETFDRDRDPNYHPTFEVFLNTEVNKVTLSLLDENGLVVWKPRDVVLTGTQRATTRSTGADFVDKHKADLIHRVPSVMEIVDCIRCKGFTSEMYNKIYKKAASQDQMRELYNYLNSGRAAKAEFYQILQQKHPELVTELESGSGLD